MRIDAEREWSSGRRVIGMITNSQDLLKQEQMLNSGTNYLEYVTHNGNDAVEVSVPLKDD